MKISLTALLLLLFTLNNKPLFSQRHPVYEIERQLVEGDKEALRAIAPYFDDKQELIVYLGYHRLEATVSGVARGIVDENCSFSKSEIDLYTTNTSGFLAFLDRHYEQISFSPLADAFIITPFKDRTSNIEFRELTDGKLQEIQADLSEDEDKLWLHNPKVQALVKERDPECLLLIAAGLYKIRDRFNIYHFNQQQYLDYLGLLTKLEFGVKTKENMIDWHIGGATKASLDLLIYFAGHYKEFTWNAQKNSFENTSIHLRKADKETALFQLLSSKQDSIALGAFLELTESDPYKVIQLGKEYSKARIDANRVLSPFVYQTLEKLVQLSALCRQKGIDYTNNLKVKQYIAQLKADLSFKERRKLEEQIISGLSLEEIPVFEYWLLMYENPSFCAYSAGRILDVFYSNHFSEILQDREKLLFYLKKAYLLKGVGSSGRINKYLVKFTGMQDKGIDALNALATTEPAMIQLIAQAKVLCLSPVKTPVDDMKVSEANRNYRLHRLSARIHKITKQKKSRERDDDLIELLSKIAYHQIGTAIREIEPIEFEEPSRRKYSFLEQDFGFFMYKDFSQSATREKFLSDYNRFSELDFHKNMLQEAGLNYFDANNLPDYDRIYDALKYNVVDPWMGGNWGIFDNEVYSIIKILEFTHKTTLGYPLKICNSNGIYGCNAQDRANYWMQYLRDKKLLKEAHDEPVSFGYEAR